MDDQLHLPGVDRERFPLPAGAAIKTRTGETAQLTYQLVDTPERLQQATRVLRDAGTRGVAWDTETSGLKPELGARIAGHCLACEPSPNQIAGFYLPVRHIGEHNAQASQLDPDKAVEALRDVFASAREVITYHAKFELKMARADGFWVQAPVSDVAIEATAHNENEPRFALKWLAESYVTEQARDDEKALGAWLRKDAHALGLVFGSYNKKQRAALAARGLDEVSAPTYLERFGYSRAPVGLAARYGIHDAFYTYWLSTRKYAQVRQEFPKLWQREHRVMWILLQMEWRGLPVDVACIRQTHELTKEAVQFWLRRCRDLCGDHAPEFEGSDEEIREVLYTKLGLEVLRTTDKNLPSVDKQARKLLAKKYPQHAELLEALDTLAVVQKLHTTYAGAFLRHYSPVTKTVNPAYNQLERRERGAPVTGRLSSADPNAQNVAKQVVHLWNCGCEKCAAGRGTAPGESRTVSVHRYFTVPKGHVRAYFDFSQIELVILAWFCQEWTMIEAFREGRDLHQAIADALDIARAIAKQVNFGLTYGLTARGLAVRLPGYYDDPEAAEVRAQEVLEAFFARFPRVMAFRREFAAIVRAQGNQFQNPFGRPRRIPELSAKGDEKWLRKRAERQMMSSIVSGTAADLLKESLLRTDPLASAFGAHIVQTIHDEIVFDIPLKNGWADLVLQIAQVMEDWPQFSNDRPQLPKFSPGRYGVPIRVGVELTTTTWEDKRKIEICGDGFRWAA